VLVSQDDDFNERAVSALNAWNLKTPIEKAELENSQQKPANGPSQESQFNRLFKNNTTGALVCECR